MSWATNVHVFLVLSQNMRANGRVGAALGQRHDGDVATGDRRQHAVAREHGGVAGSPSFAAPRRLARPGRSAFAQPLPIAKNAGEHGDADDEHDARGRRDPFGAAPRE